MFLIYTRKSTDDADNQMNSLEYQEKLCCEYAKRNNLAVTTDSAEGVMEKGLIKERHSAYKASKLLFTDAQVEYQIERPKFMQMVNWLLEGKYEGVIVLCWDRISRNEQSNMIVNELIEHHNINFKFVQADYAKGTSAGAMHRKIDGLFAEHHSRVTSEKVCIAFQKLRAEQRCTYTAPIGYLDEGSDKKELDPERAPIIKRMFELYATGEWSLRELHKWAIEQGLTTKPRRRKRSRGEIMDGVEFEEKVSLPVSFSTAQFILTNPFYIGKLRYKDEILDGRHPPLVDVSLFNRVQEMLKEHCVTVKYSTTEFFSYRGLFRCSCGRVYTPYRQKGHVYYSSKCKGDCANTQRNVVEDVLVGEIQKVIDQIYFSDEELQEIEAGAKSGLKRVAQERDKEIEDLNRRRKRALEDLDYLKQHKITLLRENAMKPEEWREETDRLLDELKEVDALLEAQTATEEEMLTYVLSFSELMKSAAAIYKTCTDMEKRKLAHLIFSELILVDGKLASYKAKPEFEILLNRPCVQNGSRGRTRTDNQRVNSALLYH